jgi:hypothetical protein
VTARTTYEASVLAAAKVKLASDLANEVTRQTTIDGSNTAAGYTTQTGTYSTLKAAHDSAAKAKLAADLAAEQTRQASLAAARDTLRDTGDRGAF